VTARELIKSSLRLIGVIATGEDPSAAEQSDALSVLNDIIESWGTDGLLIYEIKKETFPLVVGQQQYTIGVGGNFNTTRPKQIHDASIYDGSAEYQLKIMNIDEWAEISVKDMRSALPQYLFAEGGYPLDRLNLFPVPGSASSIILYSSKPLTGFATVDDTVSFPPGYARALRYNLAMELAPEYGKEPSALVASVAMDSKSDLKRVNTEPSYMESDALGLSTSKTFNWLTGE
jgi:hypothetical protein